MSCGAEYRPTRLAASVAIRISVAAGALIA
jgi:hypothetical protein